MHDFKHTEMDFQKVIQIDLKYMILWQNYGYSH